MHDPPKTRCGVVPTGPASSKAPIGQLDQTVKGRSFELHPTLHCITCGELVSPKVQRSERPKCAYGPAPMAEGMVYRQFTPVRGVTS